MFTIIDILRYYVLGGVILVISNRLVNEIRCINTLKREVLIVWTYIRKFGMQIKK